MSESQQSTARHPKASTLRGPFRLVHSHPNANTTHLPCTTTHPPLFAFHHCMQAALSTFAETRCHDEGMQILRTRPLYKGCFMPFLSCFRPPPTLGDDSIPSNAAAHRASTSRGGIRARKEMA